MPTLDAIRAKGERDLEKILAKLDKRHRAMLRAAIQEYGRVQDIPQAVWDDITLDTQLALMIPDEEETAAIILLLIMSGDEWTTDAIRRQGVDAQSRTLRHDRDYVLDASRRVTAATRATTDTLRDRLTRRIEDMRTTGPGNVGNLTPTGIDRALDAVLTPERRATIATDLTTSSLSVGQRGAANRAGDGASTGDGQKATIQLAWRTEDDDRVCPRCSPLDDTYEEVWGLVFPNGPGPEAHPRCRCWLDPVVVVMTGSNE